MATDMTPRFDDLRCADQDRELVAQVLNNAYAEGRLTFDEHADRIARAYDAKTFGDLNGLTDDLLPRQQQAQQLSQPRPTAPTSPTPTASTTPPMSSALPDSFRGGNAILSSLKPGRLGTVASEVTLNSWLGDVRIDLVDATFESRRTDVHIGGMLGEIRIRVPEGVTVVTNQVNNVMAEVKIDGLVPHPDGIVLNVIGTVILGNVTILGPNISKPRKYERFVS